MKLSLRASLTSWFTILASLLVGVSSTVLYFGVRESLYDGLDALLKAQAKGVGALCEWEEGKVHLEGYYEMPDHDPLLEVDHGFEVRLRPGGDVQVAKGVALPTLRADHVSGAQSYDGVRVFVLSMSFPARAARAAPGPEPANPEFTIDVCTAASLAPVERQLAGIRWFALVTAGASVVGVFAFGLFLSRRVTRPLGDLGRAVSRLREGDTVPLPRSGNDDEIDRLAVLFEQAFAAVRGSYEQQKRFVADASHELRNPIATLMSIAEIGRRRDRTLDEHRRLLGEIEQVAQRMARMLESLLVLARLDAQAVVVGPRIDLADVVRRTIAATPSEVPVELQAAPAHLRGDEQLLAMLCSNLLLNALRHAKSRVRVFVGNEDRRVVLRIVDDGGGLPESDREHFFQRFFRGRNAEGPGAGLGLALVRSIVRAHGGDCRLQSSETGMFVVVTLPNDGDGEA
ncbi:MAG: HAMP domain-containing sensor histidine kinase [Planctomycetota bacterium]